jgi:lipid A ethanolaminephosphotransferase
MIQNGFETDSAEALSYINVYALLFIVVTGVVPAALIYFAKVRQQSVMKGLVTRLGLIAVNVGIVFLTASYFFADYAAVGRNNSHLVGYITPYKFVDASIKYAKRNYFLPALPFVILDDSPTLISKNTAKQVTIIVVGETARAQNFSLNGYKNNTNRFTEPSDIISFTQVSSCGSATAVSLPCMFSRLNRTDYNNREAKAQQNVLDIAQTAGIDVLWIDNNNGSCKGVCERVNTIEIDPSKANQFCDGQYCLDEVLLAPMQDKLDKLTSNHTLILLHIMGSHGPTYYKRYPKDKRLFLPDCQRSDIQHCSQQEIVNTYDNTIAYTDFLLSEIIQRLETLESVSKVQTSMLYISDHGESLGEKGVYLHGMPYAFAPREQTHIPMLYWRSADNNKESLQCVQSMANETLTHDNFFDVVLGITSVASKLYNENNDVLALCRSNSLMLAEENQHHDIDTSSVGGN